MKWEYQEIRVHSSADRQEICQSAGEDGWELTSIISGCDYDTLVFKRKVQ